jgi:hypothetical protein
LLCGREVHLGERILDQAAVVVAVERLARDLLRGEHREVAHLLADLVERAPGLLLDVAPRGLHELLAGALGRGLGLVLVGVSRLARAGDDVVGLLTGLLQPRAVLLEELVGLALGLGGPLDRLVDGLAPLVQRLRDAREGELVEQEQRDPKSQQRPDHQPEAWRDEEAAPSRFLRQ